MALQEEDGLSFNQEHDEHHVCISIYVLRRYLHTYNSCIASYISLCYILILVISMHLTFVHRYN